MIYKYPDTAIVVFCKAPVAGQVKTRLIPKLSAEQATDVHIQLTHRTLSLLDNSNLCPIHLWCSPDSRHPFFMECVHDYLIPLYEQQGQDLGEKMFHAISTTLEKSSRVLLIGCDCPSLTVEDIEFAINALQSENDVVLSPAEDGGYVMVGMKKPHSEVFLDMTWGHSKVLQNTYQRVKQAGLSIIKTKQQWDIDTFDDWQRFTQMS